jgi:H+/Cl- antiporter ClcA
MSDESKTDKPNKPPLWALGCLLGFWCGVAGVMLGQYWGTHFRVQQQAQIQAQIADILRAKGRTVDARDMPRPFVIVGTVFGGCFGWSFGWLLTAFIPRGRTRSRRDYLLAVIVGLLPLGILIACDIARHLLR